MAIMTKLNKNKGKATTQVNDLIGGLNPKSRFSDSIKTIRTNLAFSSVDKKIKTILITSPEPGDGKSLIAANLAVAYAIEGKRVLVIDCDLRRGRQHEIFGVASPTRGGYSNLILNYLDADISHQFKLTDYIMKTKTPGVDLIPTGPTPPNPLELLSSQSNEKSLRLLKQMYDIIICDCPPMLGISDTAIMTKHSDSNIVVISAKKTKKDLLNRTIKAFEQANAKITGVVVNNAETQGNYGGYYSDEYYNKEVINNPINHSINYANSTKNEINSVQII